MIEWSMYRTNGGTIHIEIGGDLKTFNEFSMDPILEKVDDVASGKAAGILHGRSEE